MKRRVDGRAERFRGYSTGEMQEIPPNRHTADLEQSVGGVIDRLHVVVPVNHRDAKGQAEHLIAKQCICGPRLPPCHLCRALFYVGHRARVERGDGGSSESSRTIGEG